MREAEGRLEYFRKFIRFGSATLPLPPDGATVVPFGEFVVEDEDPPQDESAFPTAPVAMLSFNSSGFNQT